MFNRLLFILFLIPIGCAAQIPNHGMYNLLRDVVYECTLTQSVIAAYDFEETTGTTLVDETATHNGTLAASGVTINQTGNPGQAHNFQSGYHTVADHDDFTFDNDFSVSCWVNFDAVGAYNGILGKSTEYRFFLYNTNKFAMRFYNLNTSTYFQVYTDATYSAGTNYHVVFNVTDFTVEFGGYEIWVNGVEQAITTNNNPVTLGNSANNLLIGSDNFYYTDGKISQLIIRDKSLSEVEILEEYNSGSGEQYDNFCNGSSPVYYTTTVTESYINDASSGNSGSVSPDTKDFLSGSAVTLANEFTNTGSNFDGFYWNANGTSPVTSFTITQDTTVYAVYDYTETPAGSETFFASGDYYVRDDATGTGNGTDSLSNAWTFAQFEANASSLVAGDTVVFCHDDVFYGDISIDVSGSSGNPVVIGAYGSGQRPIFYGSEAVTSWTVHSGNIYKATVSNDVEQVFIDGNRATLARYPNSGYFDIGTVQYTGGIYYLSSPSLNTSLIYDGATGIFRTTNFTMYDVGVVDFTAGNFLQMESAPYYGSFNAGEGFFLVDKLEFLDAAGEWFYDTGTNTLYAWMPGSDSPTNYEVRAATTASGVTINPLKSAGGKNYINIEHLELKQFGVYGVYAYASDYVTINNVVIDQPDVMGISAYEGGCDYLTVTNCEIDGANVNAMRVYGTYSDISNNTISNTGLLANINKTTIDADNFGTAIYHRYDYPTIEYNTITHSGYAGINWKGMNGSIKYNYVNGACEVLDDGAGIYTYNGTNYALAASAGSEVMYNIVTDVHGTTAGYTGTSQLGYGIYMDNNIHDVDVTNNFVANTSCALFLHENGIINLSNNVVYDAMLALRISGVVDVNTIQNNTFYLTGRTGTFVWWTNNHQHMIYNVESSDALDFNDYYSHYEAAPFSYGGGDRDFPTWKSMTGKDANSTFDATGLTVDDTYFVNPTGTTKTFYLNGATNVEDAYGTAITTSFTVPAYSGRIILGTDLNLISE